MREWRFYMSLCRPNWHRELLLYMHTYIQKHIYTFLQFWPSLFLKRNLEFNAENLVPFYVSVYFPNKFFLVLQFHLVYHPLGNTSQKLRAFTLSLHTQFTSSPHLFSNSWDVPLPGFFKWLICHSLIPLPIRPPVLYYSMWTLHLSCQDWWNSIRISITRSVLPPQKPITYSQTTMKTTMSHSLYL